MNNTDKILEAVRKDLPNFPEDIIDQWIGYYAIHDGWPPAPTYEAKPIGSWDGLLKSRELAFWRNIEWKQQELQLSKIKFELDSYLAIMWIITAQFGAVNSYTQYIGEEGIRRFESISEYLIEKSSLPEMPILLYFSDKKIYEIVDGNHRIAVFKLFSDPIFTTIKSKYLERINKDNFQLEDTLTTWVGYMY